MARYTGAVCRLCRREATKLFLKGTKCLSDRCPLEKRNFPPGMHGKDRKAKIVGYGLQLHEKQKAKRMYFTLEGQFREYYEKANRAAGVTGELLNEQFTGNALGAAGLLVVGTELAFEREVHTLGLLFFVQLEAVTNDLSLAVFAVHAGREVALLNRATVGKALGALQKKLGAFATAKAADCSCITSHFFS